MQLIAILATLFGIVDAANLRNSTKKTSAGLAEKKSHVISSKFTAAVKAGIDNLLGDAPDDQNEQIGNMIDAGVAAIDLDEALKSAQPPDSIAHLFAKSVSDRSVADSNQAPKLNKKRCSGGSCHSQ